MEINEFIKERRKALGLSLQQVGDAINYTPQAIRKFETGTVNIDIRLVDQLIKVLNVTLKCFLNGDINNIEEYKKVPPFDVDKFTSRLRFLRENEKITQADLSKQVDIPKGRISKFENGESFPSVNEFIKLAKFYNVEYEELYFGIIKKEDVPVQVIEENKKLKKSNRINWLWMIGLASTNVFLLIVSLVFGLNFKDLENKFNEQIQNNGNNGDKYDPNGQEPIDNYHKVTYHYDLSDEEIYEYVYHGKTAKNLVYKHEGYILDGYYLNDVPFDFDTPINSDLKITGKLSRKEFNVIFYDYYGNEALKTTAKYLDEVVPPKLNEIQNQKFMKWSTNEYRSVTKNLAIYPIYNSYKTRVYFNLDGGSFVDPGFPNFIDDFTYDDLKILPTVIKKGYKFINFIYNGEPINEYTVFEETITIDAVYEANTYKIGFLDCYLPEVQVKFGEQVVLPKFSVDGSRNVVRYLDKNFKRVDFNFIYEYDHNIFLTPIFEGTRFSYKKIQGTDNIEIISIDDNKMSITIPNMIDGYKVTRIKSGAIKDNPNIKHINFESNGLYIEEGAFANLENLETVDMGELTHKTKIEINAFTNCPNIIYARVGKAVNAKNLYPLILKDYGFIQNNNFTVEFSNIVEEIPNLYNENFGKIKKVITGDGVKEIDRTTFDYSPLDLESLEVGKSVQTLQLYLDANFNQDVMRINKSASLAIRPIDGGGGKIKNLYFSSDAFGFKMKKEGFQIDNLYIEGNMYGEINALSLTCEAPIQVGKVVVARKLDILNYIDQNKYFFNPYPNEKIEFILKGVDYIPSTLIENRIVDFENDVKLQFN